MSRVETEQEDVYVNEYKSKAFKRPQTPIKNRRNHQKQQQQQSDNTLKDEISTAVSWPIILAVIPTLGAFIVGSAEVWSDFIMILLILFYVYKWITVPWIYYESARSRRLLHQHSLDPRMKNNGKKMNGAGKYKEAVEEELRKHELVGLTWVIVSPALAGYTLQYSRYFLSNYDKYMSSFNVTVFILAASIKPLIHIMALLRERTVYLQSEAMVDETEMEMLQKKMDLLEEEMDTLRTAFATKRDLGQVASDIAPSIQHLSKAFKRFEKKEKTLRTWSEERFTELDQKVHDFDQFICYSIEQDQRKSAQRLLVAVMFLPISIALWAVRRLSKLLPIPRALLSYSSNPTPTISATPTFVRTANYHPTRSSKHLTHPDLHSNGSFRETNMEPSDISSCLGEESVSRNDMGHRLQT
ncbi:hypothetical protein K501DRAFT_321132 [Backusella circina FSU 941]|nr:hypothetical protein K501DRAFT_321132 [Backusella circina FSU 941]